MAFQVRQSDRSAERVRPDVRGRRTFRCAILCAAGPPTDARARPSTSSGSEVARVGAHNAPTVPVRAPAPRALGRHLARARRPFAAGPLRTVSRHSTQFIRYAHYLVVVHANRHAQCPHCVPERRVPGPDHAVATATNQMRRWRGASCGTSWAATLPG